MSDFMQGVEQGARMASLRFQMEQEEKRLQEQIRSRMEATRLRQEELIEQQAYNKDRIAAQDKYYDFQKTQEERRFLAEQGRQNKSETDRINKDENAAIERQQEKARYEQMYNLSKEEGFGKLKPEQQAEKLSEIAFKTGDVEGAARYMISAKTQRARGSTSPTKEYLFTDPDTEEKVSVTRDGFIEATKSVIERLRSKKMLAESSNPKTKSDIAKRDAEIARLRDEIQLRERELERIIGRGDAEEDEKPMVEGKRGVIPGRNLKWEIFEE